MGFVRTEGWETGVLFPTFPSLGPRSERSSHGGSPGKQIFNHTYFYILVI